MRWSSPDDAVERVQAWLDAGRAAEALQEVQGALASFPDDAHLHAVRAIVLIAVGNPSEAVVAAERAIGLDPELGPAHTTRAQALLAVDGDPISAAQSAATGVRMQPTDHAYFILVVALLERGNTDEAGRVVQTLRSEWPGSSKGPLAMSLIAMDRVRTLRWRSWPVVLVCVVASSGLALPFFGLRWLIIAVRNQPHLRQAHHHLHAGLALDPHDADLQLFAAEVLGMRFRYGRALDYELSAAALDVGLVDAGELAGRVGRRLAIAITASFLGWVAVVALLDTWLPNRVTGAVGLALAVAVLVGLAAFRQAQVGMLPRRLRRAVAGHVGPILAAGLTIFWLPTPANSYLNKAGDGPRGYWLASLLSLPVAALGTLALSAGFLWARLRRR